MKKRLLVILDADIDQDRYPILSLGVIEVSANVKIKPCEVLDSSMTEVHTIKYIMQREHAYISV